MNLTWRGVDWGMSTRLPYPSDVSDDEWEFVAPYLTLLSEDVGQRKYALREVFDVLRYLVRTGAHWRRLPHDFPRWEAVAQQTYRWFRAGCLEAIVHDLRLLLRRLAGHPLPPPRPRLRAVVDHAGRPALRRLRLPHAPAIAPSRRQFMTGAR